MLELADSSSSLDAWRDYALSSLQANFAWANESGETVEAPTVFTRGRSTFSRAPAVNFSNGLREASGPIHIAVQTTRVAESPVYVSSEKGSLLPDFSPGMHRTVIAPSLAQRVGESSEVRFSAILAYQRMAGFSMNATNVPLMSQDYGLGDGLTTPFSRSNQSVFGAGSRVDLVSALTPWLSWSAGYQTRVNMDGFTSARGLFGQPGSYDIPPSANVGLGVALTPSLRLNMGVDRVMYAQTTPFVSSALPSKLAQLLVLSGQFSPKLEWANLSVYSVGVSWHNAVAGDFSVAYSSRQQPLPDDPLLKAVLQPQLSERSWELDYAHSVGGSSTLRFAAMYAPAQALGMPVSYNLSNSTLQNEARVEALLTTTF